MVQSQLTAQLTILVSNQATKLVRKKVFLEELEESSQVLLLRSWTELSNL
ncbi:hypothetical protein SynA1524_00718 [Synechococcus sp. A15-24]|nr:hypothetical protein SynA1524_00718 [Synechococcus sp. A15-24]